MKRIILAMFVICFSILCIGCNSREKNYNQKDELMEEDNQNIEDIFNENDTKSQTIAQFGFGFISENFSEREVYEYNGKEVCIPYYVEGMEEKVKADFGLMFFVDGIPQPYRIRRKNGTVTEEQFMHKFSLGYNEREEFDVVFTPVAGKKGDRIGVISATILKPDFIPEDENRPVYGVYHSLAANKPSEIYFKSEFVNEKELRGYSKYVLEDIPEELKSNVGSEANAFDDIDTMTRTEIIYDDKSKNVIYAKNGKVKFKFRIYGGPEIEYNTTIFVNHKPVRIMNSDYLAAKIEKGKMCTFDLELDISDYERLNTIYAISNPSGKGYFADIYFPIKTNSILLVNDLKSSTQSQGNKNSAHKNYLDLSKSGTLAQDKDYSRYLDVDYESGYMLLMENGKSSPVKQITIEKNSFIEKALEFDKGYIIVTAYADRPVELTEESGFKFIDFPQDVKRRLVKIYDKNLNLQKEIDFVDIFPQKNNYHQTIVSKMTVSRDGKKIIWAESLPKLYMYDVETGKTSEILNETSNNICFSSVLFAGDDIVFYGIRVNEEGTFYYGAFEPQSKKMNVFAEKNFNCVRMRVSQKYVVFEKVCCI
ncbi:hypothetical protein CTHBC1_1453 [Acetivibrio thermocellus BC1]|nr:hypothetical protein CTHBC1_1453 [Acetivibrio thermocellus BC1]